jgi:hypothetical protein
LFIPDPDADFLPIPDPDQGLKTAPDPGSGSATLDFSLAIPVCPELCEVVGQSDKSCQGIHSREEKHMTELKIKKEKLLSELQIRNVVPRSLTPDFFPPGSRIPEPTTQKRRKKYGNKLSYRKSG